MNPREIEVHIEELVLHGFEPRCRLSASDGVGSELGALLAKKGNPRTWLSSPERIDAPPISTANLTKPVLTGTLIAGTVYTGETK